MKEQVEKSTENYNESYLNREALEMLTQPLDISYYKLSQKEQIIKNRLLGTFDKNGTYSIAKEILKEFVDAKKYIKESKDNKYILSAPIKKELNDLLFTLIIEDDGDSKVAIMRFIETNIKVDDQKELLRTNVARYKDDNDFYFMDKVKKIFNIISDDEEGGREIDNEEFLKIVLKRFSDFDKLNEKDEEFEDLAKEYIEKILEVFQLRPGKYSEYIIRHYNIFIEELKEWKGKPSYYRKLKEKIDVLIDKTINNIKEDINPKSLISDIRTTYIEKAKNIQKQAFETKDAAAAVVVEANKGVKKSNQAPSKPKAKTKNKKVSAKKSTSPPSKKSAAEVKRPFELLVKLNLEEDKKESETKKEPSFSMDSELNIKDIQKGYFLDLNEDNSNKNKTGNASLHKDDKNKGFTM